MADPTQEQLSEIGKAVDPELKDAALKASRETVCFLAAMTEKYSKELDGVDLTTVGSALMLYTHVLSDKEQKELSRVIGNSNSAYFAFSDEAGRVAEKLGMKGFIPQYLAQDLLRDTDQCDTPAASNSVHTSRNFTALREKPGVVVAEDAKPMARQNGAPKITI